MPTVITQGAISAKGYGFGLLSEVDYIEDVFAPYLYTGNSTTGGAQSISNGINLSGKGGLVWIKARSAGANHILNDTSRGAGTSASNNQALSSNLSSAEDLGASHDFISAFNSDGFAVTQGGATATTRGTNYNGVLYGSWTFRKRVKFFDVVTYTGDGANRTIAHNLNSVPGCIFVKRTDTSSDWQVYHRSLANTEYLVLNSTNAKATGATRWNSTTATSSVFSVGTDASVNASGGTYVAYLFAHDAGDFGLSKSDNVISCGTYTGNGSTSGPSVSLGYEPQWLLIKRAVGPSGAWNVLDNLRGLVVGGSDAEINPDNTAQETLGTFVTPTATGFQINTTDASYNNNGSAYIYIAIRRGPMKKPSTGASVFQPTVYTGTNVDNRLVNTTIAPDLILVRQRDDAVLGGVVVGDRLRGQPYLLSGAVSAEVLDIDALDQQAVGGDEFGTAFSAMNGFWCGNDATAKLNVNTTSNNHVAEAFKRAPGFLDIVCYTGTGANATLNHNLGVIPEFMIVKNRSDATGRAWAVYAGDATDYLVLNTTAATADDNTFWNDTAPTASVFSVGTNNSTNESGDNFVAYLFASLSGVSKVGSYTGTGTTNQINCGFTSGARFVLIKRTDSTGDWYVWDTARGIVSGDDPYLLLNSTAAEVTNTDYIDTYSAGFEISSTAPAAINANGGTFIFLAIA